ncbi:MAG: hypothetical protein JOY92_12670 [Verrucomicrobia bacterium]|nr:hypothetical protein [Verrucomicrobiota bacterium]
MVRLRSLCLCPIPQTPFFVSRNLTIGQGFIPEGRLRLARDSSPRNPFPSARIPTGRNPFLNTPPGTELTGLKSAAPPGQSGSPGLVRMATASWPASREVGWCSRRSGPGLRLVSTG